eukprot:TRINITY_DN31476_c0_g1_i1.p1 TRINITY_DN31476_c0_g1~~TRINITY_DN31476_c0_g1_i1.p1  ORF type:complete len:409 (+),score=139.64 TRINITY_DN31476_c0_g1_i1:45-1271(+)
MTRSKYNVAESVLCYQGKLIYDAKVQEVRKEGGEWEYHVHYKGWNKSWDEWVPDARLMKLTPDNLAKQKKLHDEIDPKAKHATKRAGGSQVHPDAAPSAAKSSRRSNTPTPSGDKKDMGSITLEKGNSGNNGKKGGAKNIVETTRSRSNSDASIHSVKSNVSSSSTKSKTAQKTSQSKKAAAAANAATPEVTASTTTPHHTAVNSKSKKTKAGAKNGGNQQLQNLTEKPKVPRRMFGDNIELALPDNLKAILVDDYDYMVRQRKLTAIPARYNVEDLLQAYRRATQGSRTTSQDSLANVDEICRGMRDYFNSALGCQLLYKFERCQYADLLGSNPGISMSKLYGPIHLLRLITKLGPMLSATDMDPTSLNTLILEVSKFIQYVSKHRNTLFQSDDYGTASPEYHRRAL